MNKKEFTATQVVALQERLEKRIEVIAKQYGQLKQDTSLIKKLAEDLREVKRI